MIRFYLIVIFFLISLLSFLKAPAYYLWLLAIGVTEFPLLFAGITLFITATGFWVQKYQLAGTILGIVTMAIFLSPIVRAYWVAKDVKEDMTHAFPGSETAFPASRPPFSFLNLFKSTKDIAYHTLTYVKYNDTSLALDFYPAQIAGKTRPCIIVVHGGSWAGGDSKQLPELNSDLAAKGYNVAAINYRMAPKYQTPAPVEDVQACINYLKQHAAELKIDTTNFVLLGRSAGAQIALLAAYTIHEPGLKGVVDFYGPADMVWGYSIPSNPLIMDSRKVMEDYIGGSYSKVPGKYIACSPLEFVNKRSVPTLLIHGTNDVLVAPEHSRRLNLKLQQNDIKHYWLKLPWATHGFDYNLNGPGGELSTYAVETFLKIVTSPPAP
ncbi:alpha/beta hydrolase [Mucilaginibacter sp. BJC16-A38]|uniref:alpha/beta hydrolase n=1 Tax=Mucilaginibacter phenanthrenivorans TaxID=1234842 RepID=UPI0021588044|nr:alpha/beta hydrolase [Mucilaginibacter phenanthrenivorans]MCR8559196.1 alpha/beta hydrolase [Mucilaginibacter phenanthrenivorans]